MRRGQIVPKGPDKHLVRYYLGVDPETRKRQYYSEMVYGSAKAADVRLTELLRENDQGVAPPPAKETLAAYLIEWLHDKEGDVRARTAHDYRQTLRRYVLAPPKGYPRVALIPLAKLRPGHFTRLFRHMAETQGLSHRTVTYLKTILRMALEDAVAVRRMVVNPAQHSKVWKRPTVARGKGGGVGKKKIRAMAQAEADALLGAAQGCRYHALWHVLLLGGLRPSEAYGLEWPAVDFDAGEVEVCQALTRQGVDKKAYPLGWTLTPPKSEKSYRTVTLPRRAVLALRKWRAEQGRDRLLAGAEYQDHGFVFTTTLGSPLDESNMRRRYFRLLLERAELAGDWRIYDLRHTHATLLLAAGEDVKVVSRRLGHANVTITYDYYVHVLPETRTATAARLDTMFGG